MRNEISLDFVDLPEDPGKALGIILSKVADLPNFRDAYLQAEKEELLAVLRDTASFSRTGETNPEDGLYEARCLVDDFAELIRDNTSLTVDVLWRESEEE